MFHKSRSHPNPICVFSKGQSYTFFDVLIYVNDNDTHKDNCFIFQLLCFRSITSQTIEIHISHAPVYFFYDSKKRL